MNRVLSRSALICSLAVVALGGAVLVGWLFHIEPLMTVLPGRVSMKVNTAICFSACGLALLLESLFPKRASIWSRCASILALVVGGLTLGEHVFHLDFRIDQLFVMDKVQLINPGRMSLITSIGFCLSSVSLLLISGSHSARKIAESTAVLVTSIAFASIVGYFYGVPVLYGSLRNVNTMALHTGVGFLVLGCGMILVQSDSAIFRLLCSQESGGWLARRTLPALVTSPVLLGYLYLRPSVNFGQLRFGMALFAVTLVLSGGVALLILGSFLNRTERQQAELRQAALDAAAAIEVSERELRLVTDHLPTLISYIDASGIFLRVNRTYEEWLGLPAKEIVGRNIRELLGEGYWERTRATRIAAERGVAATIETLYPTIHGDRCAMVTYAPDLDESGALRGFACMVVDVDEQRHAEAALRQSEKLAAVGRLSSSIAHEINNPVDAAMNLVYLAREQSQDREIKNLLEIAEGELKRVANIAAQTLLFPKQGRRPTPVLAADLFTSVLTLHEGRLHSQEIQIERRDRALEPVKCFEGEIRQVLNNLVANAVDAMHPGGRLFLRSRAAFERSSGRRGIMLTIADTGSGMDKETFARVFEAFFTTKGFGGTGLGLWISADILARHGTRMRVRSSTDPNAHGTVFRIFLPSEQTTQ